jgi:hypothetical protein
VLGVRTPCTALDPSIWHFDLLSGIPHLSNHCLIRRTHIDNCCGLTLNERKLHII